MPASSPEMLTSRILSCRDTTRNRIFFAAVLLLLYGLYALQLWLHATQASSIVDESPHILAGYRAWQCGDFGINIEHPPLLKLLATAPLIGRQVIEPAGACGEGLTYKEDSFLAGTLFIAKNGADSIVVPARLAASTMSLGLALLVVCAAREMFGRRAAAVALALLAFEPNLIAHGSLVTTDMALTACMFATVFALYRYVKHPTPARFLLVGIALGLALAAKHNGLFVIPIISLLLVLDTRVSRPEASKTAPRGRGHVIGSVTCHSAGFAVIGLLVLWACYGFRYSALPGVTSPRSTLDTFLADFLPQAAPMITGWMLHANERLHVLPQSYAFGLIDILHTCSRPTSLFGRSYPTGQWFYFPVAFAVKTSLALIISLPLALLGPGLYRERRREILFLLLPSLTFFAINLTSGLNIGVRHILPLYPFLIVFAAAGICAWSRKYRAAPAGFAILLIYHMLTTAQIAPNYIAFANDLWGGPANARHIFNDSNVDWGQNIKLVNEYAERHNVGACWIAAFGNGELTRAQQPCEILPGSFGWSYTEQPVPAVPPEIEGTVFLSSAIVPPQGGTIYAGITRSKPVGLIGGTILVYHGRFEIPLAAAASRIERANQLIRLKRFREAVDNGRAAVALVPRDPGAHLSLGAALAGNGQRVEARQALQTALRLARAAPIQFQGVETQAEKELEMLP